MNILTHPKFDEFASLYEQREGLPPGSLRAVAIQESGGRNIVEQGVSPEALAAREARGAGGLGRGVFQFTNPQVIAHYKVNPDDPWDSLRGAAEYLGDNVRKYGSFDAALADYNGGPRAAQAIREGRPAPNQRYVEQVKARLNTTQAQAQARLTPAQEQAITTSVASGESSYHQLQQLRGTGQYNDIIDDALSKGYKPDEIVEYIAGEAAKRGAEARDAAQARGGLTNFGSQLATGVGNTVRGARRAWNAVTGDTEELKQLSEEQRAIDSDLTNIAERGTTGGAVGGFLGDNAAAFVPVPGMAGAGLVGRLAAQGAASGALAGATTSRGESLGEIATDTAVGAAAGGVGGGVVGAAVKYSPTGRILKAGVDAYKNRGAVLTDDGVKVTRELYGRAGVTPRDRLTPEDFAQVRTEVGGRLNAATDGVSVNITDDIARELEGTLGTGIKGEYRTAIRELLYDGKLPQARPGQPAQWVRRAEPVSVDELNTLTRALEKDLSNPNLSALTRDKLSPVVEQLNALKEDALAKAGRLDAYKQATEQYRHVKVMGEIVGREGYKGDVVGALPQAVRAGRFKEQFKKGDAPMQDVVKAIEELPPEQGVLAIVERFLSAPVGVAQGHRMKAAWAVRFLRQLQNPKARLAFESKFSPVQQAQIMQEATAASRSSTLPQATAAALPDVEELAAVKAPRTPSEVITEGQPTAPANSRLAKTRAAILAQKTGEEPTIPAGASQVDRIAMTTYDRLDALTPQESKLYDKFMKQGVIGEGSVDSIELYNVGGQEFTKTELIEAIAKAAGKRNAKKVDVNKVADAIEGFAKLDMADFWAKNP
jgi:hypothetical protein